MRFTNAGFGVTVLQTGVDIAGLSFDPVTVSEPLMWLVLAAFLGSVAVAQYDEELARPVGTVGWVLFAAYWLVLAPHFILIRKASSSDCEASRRAPRR